MARLAYPDVPLFRYDYTALTQAQIANKLSAPALGGPGSEGELEQLSREQLAFVAADGTRLTWNFGADRRVTLEGEQPARYGALTVDHVTLIAHLVPGTMRGYAIAWDRHDNRATVFELWFGGDPAPHMREVNREVWHGHMEGGAQPQGEMHKPTARVEGRALRWSEDTGTVVGNISYQALVWVDDTGRIIGRQQHEAQDQGRVTGHGDNTMNTMMGGDGQDRTWYIGDVSSMAVPCEGVDSAALADAELALIYGYGPRIEEMEWAIYLLGE